MEKEMMLSALIQSNPNFSESCIEFQLKSAEDMILNFCKINAVPPELESMQLQIAVKLLNRMGAEGSTNYSEGNLSYSFDDILTKDIRSQLYPFRKVVF